MSLADKRRPALGRGMAALLSNAAPPPGAMPAPVAAGRAVLQLPLEAVERNPHQPRKQFDDQKLEELAASIRAQGVVQPVVVRPLEDGIHYELIAGERRWRAAQMAGLTDLPAVVREVPDATALAMSLIEASVKILSEMATFAEAGISEEEK